MLKTTIGWDWFNNKKTAEEKQAFAEGRLAAIVREDGDDNAAIIAAVKAINAPAEHTRLARYDPCIGDCVLVVAWDARSVECEPDDDGWTL